MRWIVLAALLAGCTPRHAVTGRIPERIVDRMRHARTVAVVKLGAPVGDNAAGREVFVVYEVLAHGRPPEGWGARFIAHAIGTPDAGARPESASAPHFGVRFPSRGGHVVDLTLDLAGGYLEIYDDGVITTQRTFSAVDTTYRDLLLQAFPGDPLLMLGPEAGYTSLPEPLRVEGASYPAAAWKHGIHGLVVMSAYVDSVGRVGEVKVVRSVPGLDAAAVAAARRWQFRPATRDGRPAGAWTSIPIRFSLKEPDSLRMAQ